MGTRRVLTTPNIISFGRILLIPVVVWLLSTPGKQALGIGLLVLVVSTDWVDGQVARRTGQVTELGKILDPIADRLVLAAALVTLVIKGAFPLWAAGLIVLRDAAVLGVGIFLLAGKQVRIDVRFIGKAATFMLMAAVPLIAWSGFDLPLSVPALAIGWPLFAAGVVAYYLAAGYYATDVKKALRARRQASS